MAAVVFREGGFYENVKGQKDEELPAWLHGRLERKDVEQVFATYDNIEGSFLVRESTRNAGDYVLSLMCDGKVQHYMINYADDMYSIDDGPNFGSLHELVQYYQLNNERLPCRLEMPCYRLDDHAQPSSLQHNAPAPAPQPHSSLPATRSGVPLPPLPSSSGPALPPARGGSSSSDVPALPPSRGGSSSDSPALPPARGGRAPMPPPPPPEDDDEPPLRAQFSSSSLHREETPPPPPAPRGSAPAVSSPAGRTPSGSRGPPPPAPPEDDEPLPPRPAGAPAHSSPMGRGGGKATLPEQREKLSAVPRVKKWIDAAQTVSQQHIEVRKEEDTRKLPEGFTSDAVRTAASRQAAFEQVALAEEKMYLLWLNRQLKALGRPEVSDMSTSLKDGLIIMEVLKKMSGMNPPIYAKKVVVVQQEIDNWISAVKWMRKLGIPVDNPPNYTDGENVGIDPIALHSLDRREILKLFSKLLIFEATRY